MRPGDCKKFKVAFGCSDVFKVFCIRGPSWPGPEKTWPEACCAPRLAANNVLIRPISLHANFKAHAIWLHVCLTEMQSCMFGYVLLALYCHHFFKW